VEKQVRIDTVYITLGQLLKETDVIQTGGMAKWYLKNHPVFVNGAKEERRGRKLYAGDSIHIDGHGTFVLIR